MSNNYIVNLSIPLYVTVTVTDCISEEDAIEKAIDVSTLSSYAGNGGLNKLVGTREENVSIEPGEIPLEMAPFEISAELIED